MPGPVIIPSSCGTAHYTADGRPWLKFPAGFAGAPVDHEVYLEGLRLQPEQDYLLTHRGLEVDPDASKGILGPGKTGLLRLVRLEGAREVEVKRWDFVVPAPGPEPPPTCRVCGLPVPAPSMGGPDLCPACDMGVFRDGTPWTYKETVDPELVRRQALEREEDGFGFLQPARARPTRGQALVELKRLLDVAQVSEQVKEAQALCVAIEVLEQLPRLMNRPVRCDGAERRCDPV